jgi:hypothetical protein
VAWPIILAGAMLIPARVDSAEPTERSVKSPIGGPVQVGEFLAEERVTFTVDSGLPHPRVQCVAATSQGDVYAGTPAGLVRWSRNELTVIAKDVEVSAVDARGNEVWFAGGDRVYQWSPSGLRLMGRIPATPGTSFRVHDIAISPGAVWLATSAGLWRRKNEQLQPILALDARRGTDRSVRGVAVSADHRVAVCGEDGVWLEERPGDWRALVPHESQRSWALRGNIAIAFGQRGSLWIASPQGVAMRHPDARWTLCAGEDGLPFNDFRALAATGDTDVWFATSRGAFRFDGLEWRYRMAPRWLPADDVLDVAVDGQNRAWFATPAGLGLIRQVPQTLDRKAELFETQIDQYHRRTPFGYIDAVRLTEPADRSQWTQHDSDNDGLWTSMYGAGECFAYAATGSEQARQRAWAAFQAVRFLSEVTRDGIPPARHGFPARSILSTDGPDPNQSHTVEHDRQRQADDPLWKVISPRWPKSADGKWYWKCDTSSDELDGHYFLYACCHDLVARTDDERRQVRDVVCSITDHLLENQYELIDHDGQPTRWARYGPHVLNGGIMPYERGLNSLSILSYLKVARHVSGDNKYQVAYEELVWRHSYAVNVLHPKYQHGPGTGNQSDDEMAFMSYYNLLKYETDPGLRSLYLQSLRDYWLLERPEGCPFFDFVWAVYNPEADLAAKRQDLSAGITTLTRFPTDLVEWPFDHRHRLDLIRIPATNDRGSTGGYRRDGCVIPVDERSFSHWNHDPWALTGGSDGRTLTDGSAFLLPYYMGLYHGLIR